MNAKDNGGPAFPVVTNPGVESYGLTLRDYFAAKALQGMLSCSENDHEEELLRRSDYASYCNVYAESAYTFADAMLEARK